jgi:hypothetical protein
VGRPVAEIMSACDHQRSSFRKCREMSFVRLETDRSCMRQTCTRFRIARTVGTAMDLGLRPYNSQAFDFARQLYFETMRWAIEPCSDRTKPARKLVCRWSKARGGKHDNYGRDGCWLDSTTFGSRRYFSWIDLCRAHDAAQGRRYSRDTNSHSFSQNPVESPDFW